MTDEKLIRQLRARTFLKGSIEELAADRIEQLVATNEQLVKERDTWQKEALRQNGLIHNAMLGAAKAEAKLTKAVAVLTSLANMKTAGDSKGAIAMAWHAQAVLAELEKTE